jgi:hypothetical protein
MGCIFGGRFVREQVDPRIKEEWTRRKGGRAPWGDLRKSWTEQHCMRVSGTGRPEDCTYREEDCAIAFLQCTRIAMGGDNPGGLFRRLAAVEGMRRADEKPLRRDVGPLAAGGPPGRNVAVEAGGPALPVRGVVEPPAAHLPRPASGPTRLGALLGAYHGGSREGRTDDGETSASR